MKTLRGHSGPALGAVLAVALGAFFFASAPGRANTRVVAYDSADCTANLQAALNDPAADTIVIPFTGAPWTTGPLYLERSNMTLRLEPGVELVAKNGAYPHGRCLLQVQLCHDVTITGHGATLRMLNGTDPTYDTEENRHCLGLRAVDGVVVEGLACTKAGGDGIYVSDGWGGADPTYSRNVTIQDCTLDDNRRQGISVISAQDLVIQRCVMSNTGATNGTDPMAGIDFEPYLPSQRLVRCTLRDCSMRGNRAGTYGSGIHSYLGFLDGTSPPVSIRIERCHITSMAGGGPAVRLSGATDSGPPTTYTMTDCLIEDTRGAGLSLNSSLATTSMQMTRTVLRNTFTDIVTWNGGGTPIYLEGQSPEVAAYGNITFTDCVVSDGKPRSFIRSFENRSSFNPPLPTTWCGGLQGTVTVINPHAAGRVYHLDFDNDTGITLAVNALSAMPEQSVSITPLTPATSAGSATPATFAVSRAAGDVSFPLAVDLTWSGTATNGNEYSYRPGFVLLPAEVNSVKLTLSAHPGIPRVEERLAIVTVTPRPADYTIADGDGTGTLHLFDTPLPAWRFNAFGHSANSGAVADGADPDWDGVSNLREYALGGNPRVSDAATGCPVASYMAGEFLFSFQCDASRTDISYIVQASADLRSWKDVAISAGGAATLRTSGSEVRIRDSGIGRRPVTVSGFETATGGPLRFARIKVVGP